MATCFLIALFSLIVRALQPRIYGFGSAFDDELMVKQTNSFLTGKWSQFYLQGQGPTALAKPPGFSMYLSISHFSQIDPCVGEQIIIIAGAGLIAFSWWKIQGSRLQSTLILGGIVLNPINFTVQAQRVYRDSFISALGTLAIGFAALSAYFIFNQYKNSLKGNSKPGRAIGVPKLFLLKCSFSMLAIGSLWGWLAITKASWIWLLPSVTAFVFYPLIKIFRIINWKSNLILITVLLFSIITPYSAVVQGTKIANQRHYGVALVDDLTAGALNSAWIAWVSVESGSPEQWVPITKSMRESVYAVSPTARLMEPWLESPTDGWKSTSCGNGPKICNNSTGWFEWDMRSAAASAGVKTTVEFQIFFARLANEIHTACEQKLLRCSDSPVLAVGLPRLNEINKMSVFKSTVGGFWMMTTESNLTFGKGPVTEPTLSTYELWSSVVPGMPEYRQVANQVQTSWLTSLLSGYSKIFGWFNVCLLAGALIGVLYFPIRRERTAFNNRLYSAEIARWMLLSTLVGIVPIAMFQVASFPTYMQDLYTSDFSSPIELFLLIGSFVVWEPMLKKILHIHAKPVAL